MLPLPILFMAACIHTMQSVGQLYTPHTQVKLTQLAQPNIHSLFNEGGCVRECVRVCVYLRVLASEGETPLT